MDSNLKGTISVKDDLTKYCELSIGKYKRNNERVYL